MLGDQSIVVSPQKWNMLRHLSGAGNLKTAHRLLKKMWMTLAVLTTPNFMIALQLYSRFRWNLCSMWHTPNIQLLWEPTFFLFHLKREWCLFLFSINPGKSSKLDNVIHLKPRGYLVYQTVWRSKILNSGHTGHSCVLCGSQNKQLLPPLYSITWLVFVTEIEYVYCAVRADL